MVSSAIPYEGKDPYVFLSYCHKDAPIVYPLLEQMVRDGYRIWYDDGNHAGDDWLENIAKHLGDSALCLAMISENSSKSHNCKSEINLALELEKEVAGIVLESFSMPLGMRLQLGTIHHIKRQEYPSTYLLLNKLYETKALAQCKSSPGSLRMREPILDIPDSVDSPPAKALDDFVSAEKQQAGAVCESRGMPVKGTMCPSDKRDDSISANDGIKDAKTRTQVALRQNLNGCIIESTKKPTYYEETDESETVLDSSEESTESEEDQTVLAGENGTAILIRVLPGTAFVIESAQTRIGRSAKRCELVIENNAYIGNCHAEILKYKNQFYLRDLGSANGTYIGNNRLPSQESVLLENMMVFRLYDERFVFLCDETAESIASGGTVYFLRNVNSDAIRIISSGVLLLDRSHQWEDGTLSDEKISRNKKHAMVTYTEGSLLIEDLGSRNGTFINGKDIREKAAIGVNVGDRIRLGDTTLEVGMISLRGDLI